MTQYHVRWLTEDNTFVERVFDDEEEALTFYEGNYDSDRGVVLLPGMVYFSSDELGILYPRLV